MRETRKIIQVLKYIQSNEFIEQSEVWNEYFSYCCSILFIVLFTDQGKYELNEVKRPLESMVMVIIEFR